MDKAQKHSTCDLEKRYDELMNQTYSLADLAFGTIQRRWNVCGKAGCKCKKGEKHGPNSYLAFSSKKEKRMISVYLSKDDISEFNRLRKNFSNLRKELEELLMLELRIRQKNS